MSKTEMVDKLNGAGLGTKTALKKLSDEELTKMVAELEQSATEGQVPAEPTQEVTTEPVQEDKTEGEGSEDETNSTEETDSEEQDKSDEDTEGKGEESDHEVVVETVQQLGIFTEFIYHARNEEVTAIKVENLGNGDVYAKVGKAQVGNKDQRVLKGESKIFTDTRVVNLMAASQPEVKITELK
jgi:hypothetical protein